MPEKNQLADCKLYRLRYSDGDRLGMCHNSLLNCSTTPNVSTQKSISHLYPRPRYFRKRRYMHPNALLEILRYREIPYRDSVYVSCLNIFASFWSILILKPCVIDHLGVISLTSNIECSLGIIGCSLPPLRKLFKFYYGSSHSGTYKFTGEVSTIQICILPCDLEDTAALVHSKLS